MSVQVIIIFLNRKGIIYIFFVVVAIVVQLADLLPEFAGLPSLSHRAMLSLRDCSYEGAKDSAQPPSRCILSGL